MQNMQQPSPQQNMPPGMQQTMIPQQQQMEKLDNISKVNLPTKPIPMSST